MKITSRVFLFLAALWGAAAPTSALGQTIYTWTGAADGTSLDNAGNWTTNGSAAATTLPNGTFRDTAQWDGQTTTNLVLAYGNSGWPGTGTGSLGVTFVLTTHQTNSVQIISPVPLSASLPIFGITNNSHNAALTLGDGTTNNLRVLAWPAGAVHPFVNNSTNACVINPSTEWQAGDGEGYTYDFSGTGDWMAFSYLMPDNTVLANFLEVNGPGSLFWYGGNTGIYSPTNDILSAIAINGGALVVEDSRIFGSAKNQAITNNSSIIFNAGGFSIHFNGIISGPGVLKLTAGNLTLLTNDTYTGSTIVSNQTLVINANNSAAATYIYGGTLGGTGALSGSLTLAPGSTFAPGSLFPSLIGTFTISNNLTIAGNLSIDVDDFVSPSNDLVVVGGVLTNAGTGTLTVFSTPPLSVGDKFTLFNKPLLNGAALNVVGGGATWVNNLAVDGSIIVSATPDVFTWTGAADRTNIANAGNWNPPGLAQSVYGDWVQWDGVTRSNLVIIANGGLPNGPPNQLGVKFILTSRQTNSVQIVSTVSSSVALQFSGITNNSPHSALILGDGTANNLSIVTRPPRGVGSLVNNSTAANIINPSVNWLEGGGSGFTYDFSGPGNWVVNNYLIPGNGSLPPYSVEVDGPGLVFWSAGRTGTYTPNTRLTSIIINGGGLILQSSFPFNDNVTGFSRADIMNSGLLIYSPTNGTDAQTLDGDISGSGLLIMNGGKLTLGGDNSAFGGGTIISNGVLALAYNPGTLLDGTLNGTTNIFLAAGAVLDVSGRSDGNLPLIGGQTLTGGGTINGSMDTLSGGTVAPGLSIGTLTVTNVATLGGNIVMEVNRVAAQTSDRLVASTISLGGTLTVLNIGPKLRADDTFHLFDGALSGTFATFILPNYYAWDTSKLGVDGTLKVSAVTPPNFAVTVSGGNVNFSATNGLPNGNLLVLSSTNLTLPWSVWTPVDTNIFDLNGAYGRTIPLDPTVQRQFYVLQAY